MLHRVSRLKGAVVQGTDGQIGKVDRLYVDPERWMVSHLVVDPDKGVDDRAFLLSPNLIRPNWNVAVLQAATSRQDVSHHPHVDGDEPPGHDGADAGRLRNTDDFSGLHIDATDGEIGHVDDLLIDEASWQVRYLIVDTSNWIGGKWVAVTPGVLRGIDWESGKVEVAITRDAVKNSPEMDAMELPTVETMPPFVVI
jgi:sporulation protein YlmC with PRC-barrel domain